LIIHLLNLSFGENVRSFSAFISPDINILVSGGHLALSEGLSSNAYGFLDILPVNFSSNQEP
jgi:hypothetical protein